MYQRNLLNIFSFGFYKLNAISVQLYDCEIKSINKIEVQDALSNLEVEYSDVSTIAEQIEKGNGNENDLESFVDDKIKNLLDIIDDYEKLSVDLTHTIHANNSEAAK